MPRQRLYSSNAERQAAYRARLARRQAGDLDAGLVAKVTELETTLAAATRRAETAERRAAKAEADAAVAREQLTALKLTVAALQHRLEQTTPAAETEPAAKMNRQARRQAEREAHRGRH
ncbi:MAG: hypothetical protein ACRDY0_03565 [Acidimicrobiales bacterium]